MLFKIGVLNNFAIFTETHLCWSFFFKALQVKLFKKKLQHRCFPENIEKFVRAAFLIKHVWWFLLKNPWHFRFISKIGYCLTCLLLDFLKLCHIFVLAIEIRSCDALLLSLRNYRYPSHKQFTWWIHSRLVKDVRKVIPSCVVSSIGKNYPSENGVYTDFKQAEND